MTEELDKSEMIFFKTHMYMKLSNNKKEKQEIFPWFASLSDWIISEPKDKSPYETSSNV